MESSTQFRSLKEYSLVKKNQYYQIVIDRVTQKTRPANVLPTYTQKQNNTHMYVHTYIYRTQYTTANADIDNVCLAMFQHQDKGYRQ